MSIIVLPLSLLISPGTITAPGETVCTAGGACLICEDYSELRDNTAPVNAANECISNFSSFAGQTSTAQHEMTDPADFFQNFPETESGMSVEKAKEAIEKTENRVARSVETKLT